MLLLVPSIWLVTCFCHFCIPNSPPALLVLLLRSSSPGHVKSLSLPPIAPSHRRVQCWSEASRSCHMPACCPLRLLTFARHPLLHTPGFALGLHADAEGSVSAGSHPGRWLSGLCLRGQPLASTGARTSTRAQASVCSSGGRSAGFWNPAGSGTLAWGGPVWWVAPGALG